MAYYNTANLSKNTTEYTRHYGNFRGVDFSTDHTQINESRLAYLVNMYKDYQSGQGEALETVPGYRRRVDLSIRLTVENGVAKTILSKDDAEIYGIFCYKYKDNELQTKVLIHSGVNLFEWHNYPNTINVEKTDMIAVPTMPITKQTISDMDISTYEQILPFKAEAIISLNTEQGESLTESVSFDKEANCIRYISSILQPEQKLIIKYFEGVIEQTKVPLFSEMNRHKSNSFIFNNKLYLLDGKNYLVYDGTKIEHVKDNAYIPTTWQYLRPDNTEAKDIAREYEQRNILSNQFRNTFIADGTNASFSLMENELQSVDSVICYGIKMIEGTDYSVDLARGVVTFASESIPKLPQETVYIEATENSNAVMYEDGFAGVEIIATKPFKTINGVTYSESDISELITKCTLVTTYDGRVFVTGNSEYHNHIFYCARNSTGYADPSYFGILNYMQDGVGYAPITGIMCVSDTLMVLKSDTQQDSSIYFHTGQDTNSNILPRIYPSVQGLSGLGCVGACRNFLDDPIFISRLGVEGVSQLKIAAERVNEHRSKLIDAVLVNNDLSEAVLDEWGGYLCLLVNGKLFLADSRQRYTDSIGVMQYEWYFLDEIGLYDRQYKEYRYSEYMPAELKGISVVHNGISIPLSIAENVYYSYENETKNLLRETVNVPEADGTETNKIYDSIVEVKLDGVSYNIQISYTIHEVYDIYTNEVSERYAYLCESKGNYIGGVFRKATVLANIENNLFFGVENGGVCSFNFDKRDRQGEIPSQYYSFNDRIIYSGCATLMDNCKIPHLTKTTIKRSTVIKTKSFRNSSAKIKVRTNKKAYAQIARINNSIFTFEDTDFTDFTFNTTEQSIFAIKEKEKQWVEKQYFIYSDEFMRPFALYSVSFRYKIAGRIK